MKHNTLHWAGITASILSLAGYVSAATPGSEKYTYDASGNIIEKSIDGVVTKMAYDQTNRLIGRQTDGQSKQTTAHDAAGRPVTERNANGQTSRSLCYGYGDKVLETQTEDSKAGFYYNAEGQLVGKNIEGNVATYTWDGNVLAANDLEVFTNELHVVGGVPILSAGNVILTDYSGNTLADGAEKYQNSAFGGGLENGRFTGKFFLKELEAFVFPYRLYSSANMSWSCPDPSGFPDGCNNYTYAKGDPISRYDALGLTVNWFFNGEVKNCTDCDHPGVGGWPITVAADGYTINLFTVMNQLVWTQDCYLEDNYNFWIGVANNYIASNPGATKQVICTSTAQGYNRLTEFPLPVGKTGWDIQVQDVDCVIASPHPITKTSCQVGSLALPKFIHWNYYHIYKGDEN